MQLTVRDASKLLNVAEKTIYRWIQSGGLPAYRVAGQYRINRAMLFEWASSKRVNIEPSTFQEAEAPEAPMPSFSEALQAGGVFYRVGGKTKADALKEVVQILPLPDHVDRGFLYQALLAREQLQSTGVGDGIAIPHVRNPSVLELNKALACLCFLERPIEFAALDGQPVQTMVTLLAPSTRIHLHLLSRISFVLRSEVFKGMLARQASRDELLQEVRRIEDALKESEGR